MTDLPITLKNSPPAPAANKHSGTMGKTQANEAEFGNALARQLNDPEKPAASHSNQPKNEKHQVEEPENTETAVAEITSNVLPPEMISTEMLAALLAQQNIAAPIPSESSKQPYGPDSTDSTGLLATLNSRPSEDGLSVAGKEAAGSGLLLAADKRSNKAILNKLSSDLKQTMPTLEPLKEPLEILKSMGRKEAELTISGLPSTVTVSNELPAASLQAGFLSPVTMATTSTNNASLSTPVTQPAWADEFSQKVTWMATQRNQNAELHLNPPHLGPLDVVLKMNGDQASAIFTSPHAAVRDAIEQALPRLREMLADSGIMLGNAMVSDQTARNNQQNSTRTTAGETANLSVNGVTDDGKVQETIITSRSRHNGMVDTFA